MKLLTLVENTCGAAHCIAEHGLCLYIETNRHTLLLDTGQTDALLHNANVLGVDLSRVDTVILSHGHYDHAGGILPFSKENPHARILMQQAATEPHYHGNRYIGIDPAILTLPNVELIHGDLQIDEELFLFSGVTGRRCYPQGNTELTRIQNGQTIPDDFLHEQYLVITQGNQRFLLSGCAHAGILNILDRYKQLFGTWPDGVVSGFHMMKKEAPYTQEETEVILQTATELSKLDTIFYSGHCTGAAFDLMQEIMGEQLIALHSGIPVYESRSEVK